MEEMKTIKEITGMTEDPMHPFNPFYRFHPFHRFYPCALYEVSGIPIRLRRLIRRAG